MFSGNQEQLFGVALGTNKRIIEFISNPASGFDLEIIPYAKISSIEFKEGVFTDEIKFFTSGNSLKIEKIVKGNTKPFFDFVQRKIESYISKLNNGSQINGNDLFEKLEKLVQLRDKGIISTQEFESKKQEWLESL